MKKGGYNALGIEPEFRQNFGNFDRMRKVRFSGIALLGSMGVLGELVGPFQGLGVRIRVIPADAGNQLVLGQHAGNSRIPGRRSEVVGT